ncbi:unnamed protein product [Schistosoma rodhaini]|uniref:Integrase catalytic domain-containing protein n=1 Tax=Schistosoma rodhaini TaxID=6188 RepID=A0AA85F5T1_9TREM|nr:unnamed protein product [Schistosoma rodhaini]CAH8476084.1 unnamed protein product [Schistosoma rodhaini]
MEPAIQQLDIHSTSEACEDYLERFEIWSMTKKDMKGDKIVAHFLTFIGQEAYSLLKTLAYPDKPISLPYTTLKELLLNHVKCTSFECRERAKFHKMIRQDNQKVKDFILELQRQAAKCNFGDQLHVQLRDRLIAGINIPGLEKELLRMPNCSFQDARTACINYEAVNELDIQSMKISNTLLSRHDELQSQGRSNLRSFNRDCYSRGNMKGGLTRNCKANNKGIGAVLEQEGRPVICVSRKLSVAEQGYSQTQREALAVFWAVKRLHKYLFGKKFTIVTDHEALKFIYHPDKSLARSSAAMVQRWSIALSAYDYTIQHRSAKQIQHVDYISRQPLQDRPVNTSDCLLVQPLPVRRPDLIRETRRYFGCILSAIRKGWNANLKRRFPVYYSKRDELSTTPDGILCLNDRVVIPPSLRKPVLDDLHSGHLGVEKMKSLARLTCWWPEINADICRTANNCEKCHKLKSLPSKWTPWPVSSEAWQRIHADYCGPFLGKYYALVIIDSFSKWPEVFFTTSPNSDFTIQALRKVFSREGVPMVLVTDNGSHFAADAVTNWLNGIGCRHLFTAPRHPCSNGQAENFVRTLKIAIDSIAASTFNELERGVDTFLLQYRNAKHSVTKETPSKLLKGRILRSNMRCLESAEVTYYRGNDLRPATGIVVKNVGKSMVRILDINDLTIHNRHVDQIQYQNPGESVPISVVNSNTNECILDNTESTSNTPSDRCKMNLRRGRTIDYRHLHSNSSCGGCDV